MYTNNSPILCCLLLDHFAAVECKYGTLSVISHFICNVKISVWDLFVADIQFQLFELYLL